MQQPGKSTAPGQHWVYRLDGQRKCWFEAAQATVPVKKQVHHYAAKQPVIPPEAALRKKTVVDAQARLPVAASADTFQPTPHAPDVVDTVFASADGAATRAPAVPIIAQSAVDQLTPEPAARRPIDVEMLLAAAPLAEKMVPSSAPPAIPGSPSIPDANQDQCALMATQTGTVLIALGLVFLLIGSLNRIAAGQRIP